MNGARSLALTALFTGAAICPAQRETVVKSFPVEAAPTALAPAFALDGSFVVRLEGRNSGYFHYNAKTGAFTKLRFAKMLPGSRPYDSGIVAFSEFDEVHIFDVGLGRVVTKDRIIPADGARLIGEWYYQLASGRVSWTNLRTHERARLPNPRRRPPRPGQPAPPPPIAPFEDVLAVGGKHAVTLAKSGPAEKPVWMVQLRNRDDLSLLRQTPWKGYAQGKNIAPPAGYQVQSSFPWTLRLANGGRTLQLVKRG